MTKRNMMTSFVRFAGLYVARLSLTGRRHTEVIGTGAWAFATARAFPLRRIIATDLTPPDVPTPSNVTFMRSNAEENWTFNESFSFIHGRMLSSGIRDWPKLLAQCFRHLEPGGLLELLDLCHPFQAENLLAATEPSELPTSDFLHWGRTAERCWAVNGLDYRATEKHVARLQELGFEDIKEDTFRWPLGSWPEDEWEASLGELNFRNFTTFITTAGTTIIRQDPMYTEEEAQKLVDAALKDLEENHLTRKFFLIM
ncbi:MAG: hypothetical protein LQ349_003684 [Xanthoria aureola]|nr:MAG: hypothetical protein LQ349_003684 [Xanthoria aureola]